MASSPQAVFHSLTALKADLRLAVSNQEYHKLMALDAKIRAAVEQLVPVAKKSVRLSDLLSAELKDLQTIYHNATERCSDRSEELKKEYQSVISSKQVAGQYLDVAGKMG